MSSVYTKVVTGLPGRDLTEHYVDCGPRRIRANGGTSTRLSTGAVKRSNRNPGTKGRKVSLEDRINQLFQQAGGK